MDQGYFYVNLETLFREIGINPPTTGTKLSDCVGNIDEAILRVRSMRKVIEAAVLAERLTMQFKAVPMSASEEQNSRCLNAMVTARQHLARLVAEWEGK